MSIIYLMSVKKQPVYTHYVSVCVCVHLYIYIKFSVNRFLSNTALRQYLRVILHIMIELYRMLLIQLKINAYI